MQLPTFPVKSILASSIAAGLFTCFSLSAFADTQTTKFLIFLENGKQAGEQVVQRQDDGLTKVSFIFKDNGRGPELKEEFRVGADGLVSEFKVTGTSTFGAPINENFRRIGNQAEWHSTSEKGSKQVEGSALYIPLNSSFETGSIAVSALAARNGAPLPLLPTGSLSQTKIAELEVSNGKSKQVVQLLAQTGIGLSPSFLWATTGEKPRLFAVIAPGYMKAIEEGWEANGDAMANIQKGAEAKVLKDWAQKLQHPLKGLTVIKNARVFDSDKATVGAPSDVYVLRGRIAAILPAGSPIRGANQELDAAGRILVPGLFDMHGHVGRWDGGLNIAAGVTTVRDLGNENAQVQAIIDEVAEGSLLSPQIVPTGFLEGESPYSANNGFVVKDLAGAKNAIDWYAQHGYPQLKIYNSFPKAILKETVAYAHSRGMRVSGHIPVGLRAFEAIEAGYDEIQHINQIMLNFLATPETDTRTLDRFNLPAKKTVEIDFNSPKVKAFIKTLKDKKIALDPTLATFAFLKQKDGDVNEPFASIASHMPPDVSRSFSVGSMKIEDDAALKKHEQSYAKMVEFVGKVYKEGVPIVAGTDELAGFTLHSELAMLVKAGLTPAQALQIATKNGAIYTRTEADRGSIKVGKLADLVLVDGDPTKNIEDIRKVSLVITRGYLMYPEEIHRTMGIVPFTSKAPQLVPLAPVSSNKAVGINEALLGRYFNTAKKH
ncbi:amidohydrolase family protein [Undibacterium cyanobacteriorum]|uniref:Amidohydrolase family protein n=1 Tax=Undibacterium cyanobacteriorum TaxID=3073561 RepID=A0ABY9RE38_9BURK|nr:amidohydrolase family protein [Undibacterium sp. 20NA77.5]WMW79491.1 amidohydrolase family protein [Undibacterium sp. 20NA77.5]